MSVLKTKKFFAALNKKGQARTRAPFMLPSPDGSLSFVELNNGKVHKQAYVVYIGVEISVEDVLKKCDTMASQFDQCRELIESSILELQSFKISNVLAVEANNGREVKLRLVANSTKSEPGPKLP